MSFSTPDVATPMTPPPQPLMRMAPREEKKDEVPWLLSTPKLFSDPGQQGSGRNASDNPNLSANPLMPGAAARSPWSKENLGMPRPDALRALSPVTDFNWDAREASDAQKDSYGADKSRLGDSKDRRAHSPFATRQETDGKFDSFRPNSTFEMFSAHIKEKLTAQQLERRADFEQLLNPNAGPAGKAPNSLDPVVSLTDTPKHAAPLVTPTLAGSKLESKTADPMAAFNQQHERLRGPELEAFDKKYSPAPARPAVSPLDPHYQAPLNQQPSVHQFPTRKF